VFTLNVVLPSGLYLTESVDSITLPTIDGQRTLLPNHMATVLPIETGVMYLKHQGQITHYYVSQGAFTFEDNTGTLMAQVVENEADIDFNRAQRAKERAQERLDDYEHTIDMVRAEAALKRALMRLRLKD